MIKYKVKDVAADLGVANKKITEILDKYCNVNKKAGTSLEDSELDVIFDVITQENKVESLDAYFASRNEKIENGPAPEPEKKQDKAEKTDDKKQDGKPAKAEDNKPENKED